MDEPPGLVNCVNDFGLHWLRGELLSAFLGGLLGGLLGRLLCMLLNRTLGASFVWLDGSHGLGLNMVTDCDLGFVI
jgi:hypothetical protein